MKKITVFCLIIIFFAGMPAFSQTEIPLDTLQETMDEFASTMALSLPFNSSLGLNWSDAFIKKFPHFGLGVSVGLTTMESDSFGDLLDSFDLDIPNELIAFGGIPIPSIAFEGRLGGFGLPFDLGFKGAFFNLTPGDDRLSNILFGGDVRYALLQDKGLVPSISVGMGFNYLKGGYIKPIGSGRVIKYPDTANQGNEHTLTLSKPTLNIDWSTASLDFKAQISKSIIFITPYLGIGASNGWSKAGYDVDARITDSDGNINNAKSYFRQFGINDLGANGFSSEQKFSGWSFRLFGGISFNAAIFKIDITGLYNFRDSNYGFSLGARLQI